MTGTSRATGDSGSRPTEATTVATIEPKRQHNGTLPGGIALQLLHHQRVER